MRLEPRILAALLLVAVLFISGCAQSKTPAAGTQAVPSLDSEADAINSEIGDFEASVQDLTPEDFDIEVVVE